MSRGCYRGLGCGSVALEGGCGPCKDLSLLHVGFAAPGRIATRHRLLASSRSKPCYGSRTLCHVVCLHEFETASHWLPPHSSLAYLSRCEALH